MSDVLDRQFYSEGAFKPQPSMVQYGTWLAEVDEFLHLLADSSISRWSPRARELLIHHARIRSSHDRRIPRDPTKGTP